MNIKKYITLFLSMCLVVVLFGSCNQNQSNQNSNLVKVSYGVSPFQDTLVPMFGKHKGWYKEEGLDVEFKILGWTEVQEALSSVANNRIDLGINNISSVVATHHNNPDLVYYYGFNTFDNGFALMIRPKGTLKPLSYFLSLGLSRTEAIKKTAEQLKGKTVVTTSNTDMEQGVAAAAKRGNLDFKKDIKIINLNPDEGLAAFLTGQGDAYIGGIPQRTRATKEGNIEMLTGADLGPPPINGMVTTKTYAKNNEETLLKLLKVWFRIVQYIDANLDEGADVIVKILNQNSAANFTNEDFKRFWNKIEHYPPTPKAIEAEILSPTGRNYWRARWDDCNHYFYNIVKTIPQPVSPEGVFLMPSVQESFIKKYGANG
jgi:ABC-type nitrate/sulfonate/bicarbonate transport system substrate-binding protein